MKTPPGTVPDLVDQGFMDARYKLLDIAAFLDRLERHGQEDDFRIAALYDAIKCLSEKGSHRGEAIQMLLSDPSEEPIAAAHTKGATGAFSPEVQI
jgi:hypothetical protein